MGSVCGKRASSSRSSEDSTGLASTLEETLLANPSTGGAKKYVAENSPPHLHGEVGEITVNMLPREAPNEGVRETPSDMHREARGDAVNMPPTEEAKKCVAEAPSDLQENVEGTSFDKLPAELCNNCQERCKKVLRCGACKVATYCSVACQKENWRSHKLVCKAQTKPEILVPTTQREVETTSASTNTSGISAASAARVVDEVTLGAMKKQSSRETAITETCNGCGQTCTRVLRCGVCKSATYCSSKCQKDDWQFHKRVCKKPKPKVICQCGTAFEEGTLKCLICGAERPNVGKGDISLKEGAKICVMKNGVLRMCKIVSVDESRVKVRYDDFDNAKFDEWIANSSDRLMPPPEDRSALSSRPHVESPTVVDNDDVDDWYRHREWRPDEKQEFKPSRVEANGSVVNSAQATGSAWNAAGTWEEKDMLHWWESKLMSLELEGLAPSDGIKFKGIDDVSGEASVIYVRGAPKFLFDLEFKAHFEAEVEDDEKPPFIGHIRISDFSNDSQDEFHAEATADCPVVAKLVRNKLLPRLKAALYNCVSEYEAQA